jgi:hypothetical protein
MIRDIDATYICEVQSISTKPQQQNTPTINLTKELGLREVNVIIANVPTTKANTLVTNLLLSIVTMEKVATVFNEAKVKIKSEVN